MKRLLLATAAIALAAAGSTAYADTTLIGDITSDHCDCLLDGQSAGTVMVTDNGSGTLSFTVTLNSGFFFVGGGFEATFAYNLADDPSIVYSGLNTSLTTGYNVPPVTLTRPVGTLTQTAGALMVDGYGNFEYGVDGNFNGNNSMINTPLTFSITSTTVGTTLSLESLQQSTAPDGSTPFFAIDIFGNNTTGAVDVSSLHAVPGPIVGAGIPGIIAACGGMFGLNFLRRRRNGSVPA
jgi:hypothetical protein